MYSSTGYIYSLGWNGNIKTLNIVFFSGANCTGTAYIIEADNSSNSKTVFYSKYLNKYYVPKTINADGTAYASATPVTTNSYDKNDGSVVNYTQTSVSIELVETTKALVGIPATITPPLTIVFK